jgi:hypothetical protein
MLSRITKLGKYQGDWAMDIKASLNRYRKALPTRLVFSSGIFWLGFAISRAVFTCQYEPIRLIADCTMIAIMVVQIVFVIVPFLLYEFWVGKKDSS